MPALSRQAASATEDTAGRMEARATLVMQAFTRTPQALEFVWLVLAIQFRILQVTPSQTVNAIKDIVVQMGVSVSYALLIFTRTRLALKIARHAM